MKRLLNLSLIAFISFFSLGIFNHVSADTNYRNFKKQISKPVNNNINTYSTKSVKNKNVNFYPIKPVEDKYALPQNNTSNNANNKENERQKRTTAASKNNACPKCQMQKADIAVPMRPIHDPKGSSVSVDALGSVNQESLFCAYSRHISREVSKNLDSKMLRVKICPAIAVEFILHHNGEITGARFVSTHKNSAYNQNVIDAVNKINLKNLNVTLPPNVSKYVKVKVTISGRGLCY